MKLSKEHLWLEHICKLVETDFVYDMDCKQGLPDQERFTQVEAKKMAKILSLVYKWAHRIHCGCGNPDNPENIPADAAIPKEGVQNE